MRLEPLYELTGSIDTRKVLQPNDFGPRMEITFSGNLHGLGPLAGFAGHLCSTFVANPGARGIYRWKSEAIAFGPNGPAFGCRGVGIGARTHDDFVYRGSQRLRAVTHELRWLEAIPCVFEYRQDANTLAVRATCHALTGDHA